MCTIHRIGLFICCLAFYLCGCGIEKQSLSNPFSFSEFIWGDSLVIEEDLIVTEEVLILPGAYIKTVNGKKIQFLKGVTILGDSHVFDADINIEFGPGTLTMLNPCWFGARKDDHLDDTKAFKKVLTIAREYHNSVTIYVPVGRFYISETLEVASNPTSRKSINWKGGSMSNSSIQGASLNWIGPVGGTMLRFSYVNQILIEHMDFTAKPEHLLKHNIEFVPFVFQVTFRYCSFTGSGGEGSANINLNEGNNLQVSEVGFESCAFNGMHESAMFRSASAIIGGLSNTKNFYFSRCQFASYQKAAIDIEISDILHVEGCTFAQNEIDINCLLCGTYATSNYSEHSSAFFNATVSSNASFTTLINNRFSGHPTDGYVIRNGAGSLILMNNHFGLSGDGDDINRVRWSDNVLSSVFSTGNYYKNTSGTVSPFFNGSGHPSMGKIASMADVGGAVASERIALPLRTE